MHVWADSWFPSWRRRVTPSLPSTSVWKECPASPPTPTSTDSLQKVHQSSFTQSPSTGTTSGSPFLTGLAVSTLPAPSAAPRQEASQPPAGLPWSITEGQATSTAQGKLSRPPNILLKNWV